MKRKDGENQANRQRLGNSQLPWCLLVRGPLRPLTASPSPSLAFPQSLHNSKNISHVSRRCQTSRSCGQEKNSRTEDNSFNLTTDPFGRVGWGQNTRRYSVTLQQPCGAGATAPPLHDEEAEPQRSHRTHWTVVRPGSSRAGAGACWPQSLGARPQGHPAWALGRGATPPDQHEHEHTTQAGSRLINLSQGNICDELCSSSDASVNCTRVRGCYAGKKGEAHGRRGLLQGP